MSVERIYFEKILKLESQIFEFAEKNKELTEEIQILNRYEKDLREENKSLIESIGKMCEDEDTNKEKLQKVQELQSDIESAPIQIGEDLNYIKRQLKEALKENSQ